MSASFHRGDAGRAYVGLAERLAEKSIPEPNSGCVLWMGAVARRGYGKMFWRDRVTAAHRLSYELAHGPIPPGKVICHKCDVPACINPNHLFLGTMAENIRDAINKGRFRPLGRPAFISQSVVEAVQNDSRSLRVAAAAYGISATQVARIRKRHSRAPKSEVGGRP